VQGRWRDPAFVAVAALAVVGLTSAAVFASRANQSSPTGDARVVRFVLSTSDSVQPSFHAFPWPAAISPDGHTVAFISVAEDQDFAGGGGLLYLQRLDELMPHQVSGVNDALEPTFSPDGRWVAFQAGSRIEKVRIDGGEPAPIASVDAPAVWIDGLDWAPNGDIVLGASVDGGGQFVRRGLSRVSGNGGTQSEFLKPNPGGSTGLV
jgi:hypothetical protein